MTRDEIKQQLLNSMQAMIDREAKTIVSLVRDGQLQEPVIAVKSHLWMVAANATIQLLDLIQASKAAQQSRTDPPASAS